MAPRDPSIETPEQASAPLEAWLLTGLLTLSYTVSLVDRFVLAFVAEPLKQDLGLTDFQLGLVQGFAFSIIYAVAGIPLGWLVDRVSRKNLIAAAIVCWSAMTMACGLARSFGALALARIGVGGGEAALTPAAYSMMSDVFPRRQLPVASMIYSLGPTAATALAAWISGAILGAAGEDGVLTLPILGEVRAWRVVLVAVGASGLLVALAAFSLREPERSARAANAADEAMGARAFLSGRGRTHVLYMLAAMLSVVGGYALSAWNPVVLGRTFGWSPAEIGATLGTIGLACGLVGSLLGGVLSSWLIGRNRAHALLWIAAGAMALLALCGFGAPFARSGAQFLAVIAIGALTTPFMFMVAPTLLQLMTPAPLRGRVTAVFLLLTVGVGAGAGPALVGALSTYLFRPDQLALALGSVLVGAGVLGSILFAGLAGPLRVHLGEPGLGPSVQTRSEAVQPET